MKRRLFERTVSYATIGFEQRRSRHKNSDKETLVEATKLKGKEQKALVERIVRKIVTDAPLDESKKSIVISMLDEGIVGDVIDLVVSATKGELDINSVEKVATGCCLAFLKSRKAKNEKLTPNPLH